MYGMVSPLRQFWNRKNVVRHTTDTTQGLYVLIHFHLSRLTYNRRKKFLLKEYEGNESSA